MEVQTSLKQEVLQLQKQLHDQYVLRHALEKALSCRRAANITNENENSVPKAVMELIKEISVLELEVVHLEQYLLSLYRETLDERTKAKSNSQKREVVEVHAHDIISLDESSAFHSAYTLPPQDSTRSPVKFRNRILEPRKLLRFSIKSSYSTLLQNSNSVKYVQPVKLLAKAVDSYHSLPLSMLEQTQNATSDVGSLSDQLDTCISGHVRETANRLSEEMIKCISAIYRKLADPPLLNHDYPSSPSSSSSTTNEHSRGQGDLWSPPCRKLPSFNSHSDGSFNIRESKPLSGPYWTAKKVHGLCRDSHKLKEIDHMLQKFRSLAYGLEQVDPRKLQHAEKFAFWINVHNALAMHEFLDNGIPHNDVKRMSLLLKAAYNVGGHTITVDMIQSSILGCRMPRPEQWFWRFFSPKTKFKVGYPGREYAIGQSEPLLYFALCSGSLSDPAVRIYTPKRVFQELKMAQEEYIRLNITLHKERKILLPRVIESFANDLGMCRAGLMEFIEQFIPNSQRNSIQQYRQHRKSRQSIEWIPHNFSFQYLLSRELAATP